MARVILLRSKRTRVPSRFSTIRPSAGMARLRIWEPLPEVARADSGAEETGRESVGMEK